MIFTMTDICVELRYAESVVLKISQQVNNQYFIDIDKIIFYTMSMYIC